MRREVVILIRRDINGGRERRIVQGKHGGDVYG